MLTPSDISRHPDFVLGELMVSPSTRRVSRGDQSLTLEPRVMQVLVLLSRHPNDVVTREQLFAEVWGGAMVGDDSINRAVSGVRRAVEIDAGHLALETIPRTGYLLKVAGAGDAKAVAGGIDRRVMIGGAVAAAGIAAAGAWGVSNARRRARADAFVAEAEQALRIGQPSDQARADHLLQRAISADPQNARANGLLAYMRVSGGFDLYRRDAGAAEESADRMIRVALRNDPNEPLALLARVNLERAALNWAQTEDRLRAILDIAPRNVFALSDLVFLMQGAGRTRLSWDYNERALATDPLALTPKFRKALKSWIMGDNVNAFKIIDKLSESWPRHPAIWNAHFLILAFTGRADAALALLDDRSRRPAAVTSGQLDQWRPTLVALKNPGPEHLRAARAANIAAASGSPGQAAYGAMALSALGDVEAALSIVEGLLLAKGPIVVKWRPRESRDALVTTLNWRQSQWLFTPPMAAIRADPRFAEICDGIGLTDYWRMRRIRPDYQLG